MKKKVISLVIPSLLITPVAFASDLSVESLSTSMDTIWIMLAAFLVFFMHAGFAMVEAGFTRSKNTLNILMKNLLTVSIASILYFLVGYALMFGSTSQGLFGSSGFFLIGETESIGFFVFQAVFAATCATIISGAVAERIKLGSFIFLVIIMTGFIYPVVGHWVWGDGWLAELGFVDFAGSTVVHLTGALGALVAVAFLGGRLGKYSKDGTVNVIPGHNIPLGALGVFILWFGWFGFNAGSTLSATDAAIPFVAATTLLSASSGVLGTALYSIIKYKRIDASLTLNGALAGLVGITAGTAAVSVVGAIIIGFIAGIILVEAVNLFDNKFKLDDPVGAISVHGICGIWGTVAVGLFATSGGLFYGGGASLLAIQMIGVVAVIAWTILTVGLSLFIVTRFTSIRVSEEEELQGLDFAEHGSAAYDLSGSVLESSENEVISSSLASRLNNLGKRTNEKFS